MFNTYLRKEVIYVVHHVTPHRDAPAAHMTAHVPACVCPFAAPHILPPTLPLPPRHPHPRQEKGSEAKCQKQSNVNNITILDLKKKLKNRSGTQTEKICWLSSSIGWVVTSHQTSHCITSPPVPFPP